MGVTSGMHLVSHGIPEEIRQWRVSGRVQGVGFRPFVYRLASKHGLTGWVQNCVGEVEIHTQGDSLSQDTFGEELIEAPPPLAQPHLVNVERVSAELFDDFSIRASDSGGRVRIHVPPDFFTCRDCLAELNDPADRRYRYPFINCTQCGPRYTLIRALPYDRPNTSMADFPLCPACEKEYNDPLNRRFHAEPVACAHCGPALELSSTNEDECLTTTQVALEGALRRLQRGEVLAVKGIGGYHLMCDASNAKAVARLRQRKNRPDKPLAVMFPMNGADALDSVRQAVGLTECEASKLCGPVRPIVLAQKRKTSELAENLAPGLTELGVFLPYSPLHQLLLDGFGAPLVATSGNLSGEPVITVNVDASNRLGRVADAFLHHDRPIVRPADDPVFRQVGNSMHPLRLGRGSAPRELTLPWRQRQPVLAVGGQMKATVTLSWDDRVVVSPHVGEMDSPRSLAVFEQVAEDLQALYGVRAQKIVCDAHRGYTTHRWARNQGLPVEAVWHHYAHASALAAEVAASGNWLVFTWDGTGMGEDGSLWGGEALFGEPGRWRRVCSMRPFRLPGGERAGREPWRSAAALHWEVGREWADCPDTDRLAQTAWDRGLNCPQTSAVGRLFDAAAALVCGAQQTSYEAQGPMQLESICRGGGKTIELPLSEDDEGILRTDWEPLLDELCDNSQERARRAETFHTSMATAVLEQARRIRKTQRIEQVGLTGGVFQNRELTEQTIALLEADGFVVYFSSEFPCNDAALGLGQAAELAAREHNLEA